MTEGATADPWATLGERFVRDHDASLRGRVRTHVVHDHLRAHLAPPPLPVVDVGGGAGHQSIPLAVDGYDVTIVDPSPWMLEKARERAHGAGVGHRIKLVEATGEAAPDALHDARFAGVLCQVNGLGVDTRGDGVDALSAALQQRGVDPIAWYGVRLFTEGWVPERPATDPEDRVLAVQLEASRRDPYRRLSRLFHLLGRRR